MRGERKLCLSALTLKSLTPAPTPNSVVLILAALLGLKETISFGHRWILNTIIFGLPRKAIKWLLLTNHSAKC